jgi:hypothetical protein
MSLPVNNSFKGFGQDYKTGFFRRSVNVGFYSNEGFYSETFQKKVLVGLDGFFTS